MMSALIGEFLSIVRCSSCSPCWARIDVDHRVRERARSFLGEVVSNPSRDEAMTIFAREFSGVRAAVSVRRAVAVAFERNRGDTDERTFGKLPLELIVLRLAFDQAEAPAIVVDHDAYV